MKSGNQNFLEPSGPLKACNGTAANALPDDGSLYTGGNMKHIKIIVWKVLLFFLYFYNLQQEADIQRYA